MKHFILITTCCALLAVSFTALSQERERRPRTPPKEAIEACENSAENDVVTFKGRRGEDLKAVCRLVENQLVAVPEHHKQFTNTEQ